MRLKTTLVALQTLFTLLSFLPSINACSMYKVTAENKTMVGCNEDAWRTTSRIWFANAEKENHYGACFTGSRKVGTNAFAPQSGMNQAGLVFSRLTAYHPVIEQSKSGKKSITNEVSYLTDILHQCESIEDVKKYISLYDHSIFIDDVFIYIDKTGDYLIVEPYKLIEGDDPTYVLANFCPSLTSNQKARKQVRFKNGKDYLKGSQLEASLDFCRSVSDTMHVSRARNGDGTLLTSIWDTKNGLVNLYFYHRYDTTVQFDIDEELALGDHIINVPNLFPENPQFERLISYKTPFNVNLIRLSLALTGVTIFLLSFLYLISYFRKRKLEHLNLIKLLFIGLNLLLFAYLFILSTNINIFYFDAPYTHYNSKLISTSSYIPLLLLVIFIPLCYYTLSYIKHNAKNKLVKSVLLFNNIVYLILIIGFNYWGLFDIL